MPMVEIRSGLLVPSLLLLVAALTDPALAHENGRGSALEHARTFLKRADEMVVTTTSTEEATSTQAGSDSTTTIVSGPDSEISDGSDDATDSGTGSATDSATGSAAGSATATSSGTDAATGTATSQALTTDISTASGTQTGVSDITTGGASATNTGDATATGDSTDITADATATGASSDITSSATTTGSATDTITSAATATGTGSSSPRSLASPLAALAEPLTNCTEAGGGCVIFMSSITSCTNDSCACDLSYPAQVCAQCVASEDAVTSYNSFLKACHDGGYVDPESTVLVEVEDCETDSDLSATGTATGSLTMASSGSGEGASGTATGTATGSVTGSVTGSATGVSSVATGSSFTTDDGPMAFQLPDATDSAMGASDINTSLGTGTTLDAAAKSSALDGLVAVETGSTTGSDTTDSLVVVTSYSTISHDTLTASGSDNSSGGIRTAAGVTGALTATATAATTLREGSAVFAQTSTDSSSSNGTEALEAAHTFFSSDIDPSCSTDCNGWMSLAQSCTDDMCICTSDGLSSASACSSCIGSSGQGGSSSDQMRAYSAFTSNCTSSTSFSGDSGPSVDPLGVATSKANPFAGSGTATGTALGTGTIDVAEANGVSTTTVAAGAAGRSIGEPFVGSGVAGIVVSGLTVLVAAMTL